MERYTVNLVGPRPLGVMTPHDYEANILRFAHEAQVLEIMPCADRIIATFTSIDGAHSAAIACSTFTDCLYAVGPTCEMYVEGTHELTISLIESPHAYDSLIIHLARLGASIIIPRDKYIVARFPDRVRAGSAAFDCSMMVGCVTDVTTIPTVS